MKQLALLMLAGAFTSLLPACAPEDSGGSGSAFHGTYEVPVAPALAGAATYDVPKVEWRIDQGTVTLDYDLPRGLVGKSVRVELEGPFDPAATTVKLSGAAGTAECTLSTAAVRCYEEMAGLRPLAPDYAVIEQIAAAEYKGPTSDRIDVAKQFSEDPIGIVHVDLGAPLGGAETGDDR